MTKQAKRTSDFHVRMSEDERARLDAAAKSCSCTRSDLIRLLAKLPADRIDEASIRLVAVDNATLARIHREMRRFGTNLNQATHALNSIAYYLRHGSLRYEYLSCAVPEIEDMLGRVARGQAELQASMAELGSAILVRW